MITADPNQLLRRAEQGFVAGRLDSARADLAAARRAVGDHPAILHLLALVEKKAGNGEASREAFVAALKLDPNDAQLNTNYANLLDALGDGGAALAHYDRAIAIDGSLFDARFNRAMLLMKLGRLDESLAGIDSLLRSHAADPRVHHARGAVLRMAGRLGEAAEAFDRAVALDPTRLISRHGRARVALERGEDEASDHYQAALGLAPDDRELLLGYAESLEAEGRADEALARLEEVVAGEPGWIDGQTVLARMRWEAGEGQAFTRSLEAAVKAERDNAPLWCALATTLAGADLAAEAAQAASEGNRATHGDPRLRLLEAYLASEAGQLTEADRLFESLPENIPNRNFSEAQHALRSRRFDRATELLEAVRRETPWDVAAWALTSLAWRLTDDPRQSWLNEQAGFVVAKELELSGEEIAGIADRLRALHRTQKHPLHQSLRGGTQTRGRLFERSEPEILQFAEQIRQAVDRYWSELPLADPDHPLLRHRGAGTRIEGSWSVRLVDGGFHVAHFHSKGIVSSAAYLVVPETQSPMEGWLEIGGAPANLDLPLEPIQRIEPVPGRLALFPSYMYHGTRPFSEGERLTAAFDVVPK